MKTGGLVLLTIIYFCTGFAIGFAVANNKPKPQPKPNKYFEFEHQYKRRLEQFHFGEINAQQYKDSIYMDVETFMIMNK